MLNYSLKGKLKLASRARNLDALYLGLVSAPEVLPRYTAFLPKIQLFAFSLTGKLSTKLQTRTAHCQGQKGLRNFVTTLYN